MILDDPLQPFGGGDHGTVAMRLTMVYLLHSCLMSTYGYVAVPCASLDPKLAKRIPRTVKNPCSNLVKVRTLMFHLMLIKLYSIDHIPLQRRQLDRQGLLYTTERDRCGYSHSIPCSQCTPASRRQPGRPLPQDSRHHNRYQHIDVQHRISCEPYALSPNRSEYLSLFG